ncbi:MAG TPA: hypothetical protein EYP67_07730 [Methanosarcinales archaeon]|nr:hypothetical protein [Methanosarcinales archaeon]
MKEKTHRTVSTLLTLTLLLIITVGVPAVAATVPVPILVPEPTPEGLTPPEDLLEMNFTKLQISPRHNGMDLMPGESDEFTVKVTNMDNKTVSLTPAFKDQPYNEYVFDPDWITITPTAAELGIDSSEEFTIRVEIPEDAERGHYNTQVAFTDEVMPTPYPSPYPQYINALDMYVSVWKPPTIQMQPSYIRDRVESGKGYDYVIHLKNTGKEDVKIDPKLEKERWYGYEMTSPAFEDDAITIDAPSVVPAGGTATVDVHLLVPAGAKGNYEGGIDLNFNDSSLDEWDRMVHLSFYVWTQPTEHFIKEFTTEIAAPITIEVTSEQYRYDTCGGGSSGSGEDEEPSFDVTLEGPNGEDVVLTRTMAAHHGSVNLGESDCLPPWEIESSGMYDEGRTKYIERYTADGAAGDWKLGILPQYVEEFEYMIIIGDAGSGHGMS